MRFTVISLAVFMTLVSSYSAQGALHSIAEAVSYSAGSNNVDGAPAMEIVASKAEKRSFVSRSRAITRAKLQRRNGSLLPDIVLPSLTTAQSAPAAPARPIPQAVSYPAAAVAAAAAAPPVAQNYYTPQPVTQNYNPTQPTYLNYAPQQPAAVPNYGAAAVATPPQQPPVQNYVSPPPSAPSITLPPIFQAPPKEEEDDDDDDEEEEDEDEEDEEDFDADDLVTRRR